MSQTSVSDDTRHAAIVARRDELRPRHAARLDALWNRNGPRCRYFGRWYSGVYFIECHAAIKIGYSNDVRGRLGDIAGAVPPTLNTAPLGFIQCDDEATARALEEALHESFASIRFGQTEWFDGDESLRTFIRQHVDRWPAPKARSIRKVS